MALFTRVYFNAVLGALGGLAGWLLFGAVGDPRDSGQGQWLLGGAIIGGSIGYCVVGIEGLLDRSLVRFCRLATYGLVLGAAGGAAGLWLGEKVNYSLVERIGAPRPENYFGPLLGLMAARGLGWMVLGMAVGLGEGVAARSLGRTSYSMLGGAIGGFFGGALFCLLYIEGLRQGGAESWGALAGAVGLVILGACIGALSALVRGVFVRASLKVLRGWQEGREYPLDKPATILGRDEHADIPLFRDMRIEKRHAVIRREGKGYVLENEAAPEQTTVNGEAVAEPRELADGDRIQLGEVVLRFRTRALRVDNIP